MRIDGKRAVTAAGAAMAVLLAAPAAGAEPVLSERTVEPGSVEAFSGADCVPDPAAPGRTSVVALVVTNGNDEGQHVAPYGSHRLPPAADGSWRIELPMVDRPEANHYLVYVTCANPAGGTRDLARITVRLRRPVPPTTTTTTATTEVPAPAPPNSAPPAPPGPGTPRPQTTTPPTAPPAPPVVPAARAVRATPRYTG